MNILKWRDPRKAGFFIMIGVLNPYLRFPEKTLRTLHRIFFTGVFPAHFTQETQKSSPICIECCILIYKKLKRDSKLEILNHTRFI